MNASMIWCNQRPQLSENVVDTESFATRPLLQVNDIRTGASVHQRTKGTGPYGYLVRVWLEDVSYDVLAAKEIDALDAFQHFLPLLEVDVAKHVWAMLRAKQLSRQDSRNDSPVEVEWRD